MISPWRNHLPIDEYANQDVVVYFYNGRWIPITCYSLIEAIALCQQVERSGYNLFIFPINLQPDQLEQAATTVNDSVICMESHRSSNRLDRTTENQ